MKLGLIDQKLNQRDHIIAEIHDTEKNYVEQLKNLEKYFITPLKKYLTGDEMNAIFINLEILKDIHIKFYEEIKIQAEEQYTQRLISVPFKKFQDKLSNYAEYLLGIDHSQEVLEMVMQGKGLAKKNFVRVRGSFLRCLTLQR